MSQNHPGPVTRQLRVVAAGEEEAIAAFIASSAEELRELAAGLMKRERVDHTLQPTALVNEAVVRLMSQTIQPASKGRSYYFGTMASIMRRVLTDHARARETAKRGGQAHRIPLELLLDRFQEAQAVDLLDLEEALGQLEAMNPRLADVVVLRVFANQEMKEIAEQCQVSLSTIEKDWKLARAWLAQRFGQAFDT